MSSAICLEKLVTNEAVGCWSTEDVQEKDKVSSPRASGHVRRQIQDISCRLDEPQGLHELICSNRQRTFTHYTESVHGVGHFIIV